MPRLSGMTAMPDEENNQDKPFTVNDRRRFTASGDSRERVDGPMAEASGATAPQQGIGSEEPANRAAGDLTFSGFVIGLAQQAFVSLGLVKDPQTASLRKDLPQAKAMIDVLAMLREKTQGNLDEVEARMMDEMIDELRLRYVRETRKA